MRNKIVEFTLMKENATFTEKQKDKIEMFIKTYNWDNFQGLISVEFLNIGDKYFVVKIDDIDNTWYGIFSRLVCDNALLHNLRVVVHGNYRLFEQQTQLI
ncbi:hypothetical protein V7152_28310 [Neobacillus drentensis]|uniref:hypothetical protein n=1 Tax=Neobacillus drentensis TaxID=220684 RepID=UPI0030003294